MLELNDLNWFLKRFPGVESGRSVDPDQDWIFRSVAGPRQSTDQQPGRNDDIDGRCDPIQATDGPHL